MSGATWVTLACEHCGQPFQTAAWKERTRRFCSHVCMRKARWGTERRKLVREPRATLECYCGRRYRAHAPGSRALFCSERCEHRWVAGCYFDLQDYLRRGEERKAVA